MNEPCAKITLDVQQASTATFVAVKRGDIGRKIVISLSDGGFPYDIAANCYAVLTGTKPDGNILYNHCDIEENTIVYEITEQTTAAAGKMKAEVKLYGADDNLITSATFRIIIDGTVYTDDKVESSSEFSALTQLMSQVLEIIKNYSGEGGGGISIMIVKELPTEDIRTNTLYLVKDSDEQSALYTEYLYVNGSWEIIGTQRLDLTGYATEEWVAEQITLYSFGNIDMHNNDSTSHADIRDRIATANIMETVRDDVVTVSDASGMELAGLRIFGKTIQNDTPAPDVPVALNSVGDGGNVEVVLANSNLLNFPYMASSNTANGLTFVVQPDGSIVINGTATKETLFNLATVDSKTFYLPKGKVTFSGIPSGTFGGNLRPQLWVSNGAGYSFSVYAEGKTVEITTPGYYRIAVDIVAGNALTDYVVKPMVNFGEAGLPFESPVSHQTLAISTPNGLPGISVASGGNYTDEGGQQWVCDEVDFENGVYIQRVKAVKLAELSGGYNGTNFYFTSTPDKKIGSTNLLCTHYPVRAGYDDFTCKGNASESYLHIYDSRYTDFNTLKAEMGDADIIYELATPIETALSAKELTAYTALHTNYPNTTIFNDGGADLEARYVADTKLYIDRKFNQLATQLTNGL